MEKSVNSSLPLATATVLVEMGCSSSFFMPLSSRFLSRWATIWSYIPFSTYANLFDLQKCDGILVGWRRSTISRALSPNARSAKSFNSSENSESDFVFGSKLRLCHLSLAVARDLSLTHFRRNTISKLSSVFC